MKYGEVDMSAWAKFDNGKLLEPAKARRARAETPEPERSSRSVPVILVGKSDIYKEGVYQTLHLHRFHSISRMATLQQAKLLAAGRAQLILITETCSEPGLPESVSALRVANPAARVVVFVDTSEAQLIETAMHIQAHAFLCQKICCEALIGALDVVLGDVGVLSINFLSHLISRPVPILGDIAGKVSSQASILSNRETDILQCLTNGSSNKLIARQFDIAESTVKIHVKGILRKINVHNRTQAAIWALAHYPHANRFKVEAGANDQLAAIS